MFEICQGTSCDYVFEALYDFIISQDHMIGGSCDLMGGSS